MPLLCCVTSRLEPRGSVDDIPCDETLAMLRPGPEGDDGLTGVDADPDLKLEPGLRGSAKVEGGTYTLAWRLMRWWNKMFNFQL